MLFMALSLDTLGMDNHSNAASNSSNLSSALTLSEAQSFLFDSSKTEFWNERNVRCNLGITAGVSMALGITGSVIAGLYCQNHSVVDQCRRNCGGNDSHCRNNCDVHFGPSTPDHPVCITGAVFVTESLLTWLLFALQKPITMSQNYVAKRNNDALHHELRLNFKKGRPDDHVLADKDFDIHNLGLKLLLAQSELLKKLSSAQALNLAERHFYWVMKLGENEFSQEAWDNVDHIRKLLEMDVQELSTTLGQAKDIFIHEPALWQALVRLLPYERISDDNVRNSLGYLLKNILQEKSDKNWDDVINNVSQGAPLSSYILKELVVDGVIEDDDQIELKCDEDSFLMSKKKLTEESKYFARGFSGDWASAPLTHSRESKVRLQILHDVMRGKLQLNRNNIWHVLDAATYFQMQKTIDLCDVFIRDSWRQHHKTILNEWLKNDKENQGMDTSSFSTYWQFCKKYSLLETKRYLAVELIVKLDTVADIPAQFSDLIPLLNDNLQNVLIEQSSNSLTKQLRKPRFLKWLFENGWKNAVIKDLIIAFCQKTKSGKVMQKAWVVVPQELTEAIKQQQDLLDSENSDDE